jgi:[acyl-carrier-protein] S-malonyltransferase
MTGRVAFLFPGQGSQYVGMGKDFAENFSSARDVFSAVDRICGKSISSLCFSGPIENLTITDALQPAVVAVDLAILGALQERGMEPYVSAGHSLGEYAALASAGIVAFEDALKLAAKRGELMHREAMAHPGGMVAVIGLDLESVRHIVEEAKEKDVLDVANHNAAEQVVITGETVALKRAVSLVKERKAKAVPLKVSGAWHSGLMAGGVSEFRERMEGIKFSHPKSLMIFNATAAPESDPVKIKDTMARQLVKPVLWYDTVNRMAADGVTAYVEVGPKNVLTGLVKKILPADSNATLYNVQDIESFERFMEELG